MSKVSKGTKANFKVSVTNPQKELERANKRLEALEQAEKSRNPSFIRGDK